MVKTIVFLIFRKNWARRDSNPRPKDYESSALPLRHRPVALKSYLIVNHIYGLRLATATLPSLSKNDTQSFFSAECQQARGVKILFNCQSYLRVAACDSYATLPLEKRYSIVFLGRVPTGPWR